MSIGQIKVIQRLGQGGFGIVDLVQDEKGNQYAKKTFVPNTLLPAELRENIKKRFDKEVRTQTAIKHPNIVPIIEESLDADPPSYLMPVADSSLDLDILSNKNLNGRFLNAIRDIVSGLEELHSVEIYHRDLKPQNVLRFGQGDDAIYAIGDFGLISSKETSLSSLTKTGAMRKASDFYTAPEIANDLKAASVRSDVYSLGCILHDMVGLEDRVPFREIDEGGEFGAILKGCTRDKPAKRFASAQAVLDALQSIEYKSEIATDPVAADFQNQLSSETPKDKNFWDSLAEHLHKSPKSAATAPVYRQLTLTKIPDLFEKSPDAANQIGVAFAEWVASTGHNFDFCDTLANRLDFFIQSGNLETKVECLMSMLAMGTSHNRWYVEWKFAHHCDHSMDDNLAKRFVIEIYTVGQSFCDWMNHLQASIGFKKENLHPRILAAIGKICK